MAAKKPQGMPLDELVRHDRALPVHRRGLHRRARESALSTDGKVNLVDAIEDEYLRLADADKSRRSTARQNAQKPRVTGDGDHTTKQVVADVLRRHDIEAKPNELIPHVHAALDANGSKAITDKWARELIRRERSSKRRT